MIHVIRLGQTEDHRFALEVASLLLWGGLDESRTSYQSRTELDFGVRTCGCVDAA